MVAGGCYLTMFKEELELVDHGDKTLREEESEEEESDKENLLIKRDKQRKSAFSWKPRVGEPPSPYDDESVVGTLRAENKALKEQLGALERMLEELTNSVKGKSDGEDDVKPHAGAKLSAEEDRSESRARRRTMAWAQQKDVIDFVETQPKWLSGTKQYLPKGMPKTDLPKFNGKAERFYQWIYEVENIFTLFQWKENIQVYVTKHALTGSASNWCRHREICGKLFTNWTELKTELQREFVPADFDDNQMESLAHLKQENSIRVYVDKFRGLYESLPQIEDAVARSYFKKGLRDATRKACQIMTFNSLDCLIRYALKYEEIYFPNNSGDKVKTETRKATKKIVCYKCHEEGHKSTECGERTQKRRKETALTADQGTRRFSGNCYTCGKRGHRAKDCESKAEETVAQTSQVASNSSSLN